MSTAKLTSPRAIAFYLGAIVGVVAFKCYQQKTSSS